MVNPGHIVMLHVRADDAQGFIDREAAANPTFNVLHSELNMSVCGNCGRLHWF
jgi:hypothetical protein